MVELSKPALITGYGAISVEAARQVAAAAIAEGKSHGWNIAVAIVDVAGELVFFERLDETQQASVLVSQAKARTAARFKRPSKAFEDAVVGGRQVILSLPGVTPIEGGIPLLIDGKIVGAVGVSGATSPQDGQCAQAGADTLGKAPAAAAPPAAKPPTPAPPAKK
jgi:uncharacterized protein GlcG (DUF336 family)